MLRTANTVARAASVDYKATRAWSNARERLVIAVAPGRPAKRVDTRRLLNVAVAVIALILLMPLMVVLAVLVKLTSPGPVFYVQTRVGIDRRTMAGGNFRRRIDYGGRLFRIYKFRTMTVEPEDQARQCWAQKDDPRVTPLGRVLRATRLDELPQLINVIKGDMNVVGPRPEQPEIFLQLREQVDGYARRQRVLPGITGWAQVNQAYDQSLDDVRRKVALDLEYAASLSPVRDMRIMLRTLPVMLFRSGGW